MIVLPDNPPHKIRELCEEVFDLSHSKPIWTFRDKIYNPHGIPISNDMLVHEAVHADQQGENPATWWDKYFQNGKFRFAQELAAYRAQYAFASTVIKDRNKLARYVHEMARDLSGSLYGHCCSHSEALRLIKDVE